MLCDAGVGTPGGSIIVVFLAFGKEVREKALKDIIGFLWPPVGPPNDVFVEALRYNRVFVSQSMSGQHR